MRRILFKAIQMIQKLRYGFKIKMDVGTVIHLSAKINNNRSLESIVLGKHTHILGELFIFSHGGQIVIGNNCYVGDHSRVWSAKDVYIGDRVLISHGVNIFDSLTHPISASKRSEQYRDIISKGHPEIIDLSEAPVRIESDVWIGCLSVILRGVTVGQGAIIGAGSIVTKDVPPWTIVAGNPAKIIREIPLNER